MVARKRKDSRVWAVISDVDGFCAQEMFEHKWKYMLEHNFRLLLYTETCLDAEAYFRPKCNFRKRIFVSGFRNKAS